MENKLRKVMFVDDDFYVNEFHKMLVKQTNMADEALFYNEAEKALSHLADLKANEFPELILIDVNMPKVNGHEFVKRLNNIGSYNSDATVVAFLTSSKDIRDVIMADENNVAYYYWKPLNKEGVDKILTDYFN